MVKQKNNSGPIIIDHNHPDAQHYQVYFKGKLVKDVLAIVRKRKVKDGNVQNRT